jgi:hypothetical protein
VLLSRLQRAVRLTQESRRHRLERRLATIAALLDEPALGAGVETSDVAQAVLRGWYDQP